MKLNRIALLFALTVALVASQAHAHSGSGAVTAMKNGDFKVRYFNGTQAGIDSAIAYCTPSGIVSLGPGLDALNPSAPVPSTVQLQRVDAGGWRFVGNVNLRDAVAGGNGPTDPALYSYKEVDLSAMASAQADKNIDVKSRWINTTAFTNLSLNGLHAINQYGASGSGGGDVNNGIALGAYSEYRGNSTITGALYGAELATSMYTSGTTNNLFGALCTAQVTTGSTATVSVLRGVQGLARVHGSGAGTIASAYAVEGVAGFYDTSSGTITDAQGGRFWVTKAGGSSGTITNAYGVHILGITQGGTNNYGLRIGAASGGSNINRSLMIDGGETYIGGKAILADSVRVAKTLQVGFSTFSGLVSNGNGTLIYCSDCTKATPCAGGGSGALAKRINGAWDCN